MRRRTFDTGGLREIGTGLQIDLLNWPFGRSAEYLSQAYNIESTFASVYHIFLRSISFPFIPITQFLLFIIVRFVILSFPTMPFICSNY